MGQGDGDRFRPVATMPKRRRHRLPADGIAEPLQNAVPGFSREIIDACSGKHKVRQQIGRPIALMDLVVGAAID
jgi:hypothetical protein